MMRMKAMPCLMALGIMMMASAATLHHAASAADDTALLLTFIMAAAQKLPSMRDLTAEDHEQKESLSPGRQLAESSERGSGYWFAVGNQILDQNGKVIKFSGVNLNGFDSSNCVMDGLWLDRPWFSYLDQMRELGFNLIRLNFATACVTDDGLMPADGSINFDVNADLQGLTVLEIMDKVIAGCKKRGLRVILSNIRLHAAKPPSYGPDGGVWFDGKYPEFKWLDNWQKLAARYAGEATVVGVDLYNEVHSEGLQPAIVWAKDGGGEPYNWRTAAKRAADAVQSANPNLLICVQGMHDNSWWGANLQRVKIRPLVLKYPNKLVYTIHEYGPMVANQEWFTDPTFPMNLPMKWDTIWGFVFKEKIAPIWIGEFGSMYKEDSQDDKARRDIVWAKAFQTYIRENQLSWTWFTWGPNSHDTGGILYDDWLTPEKGKIQFLGPIMHLGFGPSENQTLPKAPAHGQLKVYETAPGIDLGGETGTNDGSTTSNGSDAPKSSTTSATSPCNLFMLFILAHVFFS